MNSVGDAFSYPFRSPGWFGTIVLQGLILIIPIIGQIALLGWLLKNMDNLREGRQELAPAGFHLGRGIHLFGAELVYGIALYIIPGILEGVGSAVYQNGNGSGAGLVLLTLGYLLNVVAGLLLAFLLSAVILVTHEQGFSGAMNVGGVWRLATLNVGNTIVAGLLIIVAQILGAVGIVLCFIGVFLTQPYGHAVMAGVVDWYRRTQAQRAPATPGPAPGM